MVQNIVVIGGGQAGLQAAASLRQARYQGNLQLISEESYLPYQRPPLSKTFLAGEMDEPRLALRSEDYFTKLNINFISNTPVTAIERKTKRITLDTGEKIAYDRLALTTGARARKLLIPGSEHVHYLRTLDDAKQIRNKLSTARRLIIIGGGFIGLEVAAISRQLGKQVTILENQDRLMPRVVGSVVADFYYQTHLEAGCKIHCGITVRKIRKTASAHYQVLDADNQVYSANFIIAGIGAIPNEALAVAAGLDCDHGIIVNAQAITSDPNIVAAGDCTRHYNPLLGAKLRLESIQNANDQARTAAATLLDKKSTYAKIPWFWSDQYDLKLQMVGISNGYTDCIVRGQPGCRGFSVFYYRDDHLLAVDSINQPVEHMIMRRLLDAQKQINKDQAADLAFDLKQALY